MLRKIFGRGRRSVPQPIVRSADYPDDPNLVDDPNERVGSSGPSAGIAFGGWLGASAIGLFAGIAGFVVAAVIIQPTTEQLSLSVTNDDRAAPTSFYANGNNDGTNFNIVAGNALAEIDHPVKVSATHTGNFRLGVGVVKSGNNSISGRTGTVTINDPDDLLGLSDCADNDVNTSCPDTTTTTGNISVWDVTNGSYTRTITLAETANGYPSSPTIYRADIIQLSGWNADPPALGENTGITININWASA